MTMAGSIGNGTQRLTDMVRAMIPSLRQPVLTPDEADLGIHLRGNEALCIALTGVLQARIRSRAAGPVPADPMACKAILDRDNELRWVLGRLDFIYRSAVNQQDTSERPA